MDPQLQALQNIVTKLKNELDQLKARTKHLENVVDHLYKENQKKSKN